MDEFVIKNWKIIGAILFATVQFVLTLTGMFISAVNSLRYAKVIRKLTKQITWLKIKMQSMDAALEHSLKNGYPGKRDAVKTALMDDEEFINDNDEDSQKIEVSIFKSDK